MLERLALMGGSEGPWLDISKVKRPSLRITGLPEGSTVEVQYQLDGVGPVLHAFNGDHDIPCGTWVRVTCSKSTKKLICLIVSQRAA